MSPEDKKDIKAEKPKAAAKPKAPAKKTATKATAAKAPAKKATAKKETSTAETKKAAAPKAAAKPKADAKPKAVKATGKIKVTLKKSGIGYSQRQKDTLRGLGLRKLNSSKVLNDTPAIRGMVKKVEHLVSCETA